MNRTKAFFAEAELLRLKGEVLAGDGPNGAAEAERCFRQAWTWRAARVPGRWNCELATSLCRFLADCGQTDAGRETLGSGVCLVHGRLGEHNLPASRGRS